MLVINSSAVDNILIVVTFELNAMIKLLLLLSDGVIVLNQRIRHWETTKGHSTPQFKNEHH